MQTCIFMLMLQTGFTQNSRADNLMAQIIFITVKSWHLREEVFLKLPVLPEQ